MAIIITIQNHALLHTDFDPALDPGVIGNGEGGVNGRGTLPEHTNPSLSAMQNSIFGHGPLQFPGWLAVPHDRLAGQYL